MRQFKQPIARPDMRPGLLGKDKMRLGALALGVFVVGGAIAVGFLRTKDLREDAQLGLPLDDFEYVDSVALPEFDPAAIDALVNDAEQVDQVVIEGPALDRLLEDARRLTPRHFEELDTPELTADRVAEILANPSAFRSQPFFARGYVNALERRTRGASNEEESIGRLYLEDGTPIYFLVLEPPVQRIDLSRPDAPDFLRVDGLFLKIYTDESNDDPGKWISGPLFVGPKSIPSYPAIAQDGKIDWSLLESVEDADLGVDPVVTVKETPFEPLWHLMEYALHMPEGDVDWSQAPELDKKVMQELIDDPAKWRGQPVRIPVCRIQDARVLRAGENPARIESYTQGWLGHTVWPNVAFFKLPKAEPDLALRDYAEGRGFFVHNFSFPSEGKGLRTAPVFVMESIWRFEPPADHFFELVGYTVVGISVFLITLFVVLLSRDKKRSKALQQELLQRRRARRQSRGPGSVGPASA